MRTVDHHRRETHVNARLAEFERIAVVEVQHDLRMSATQFLGIFHRTLSHITKQGLIGILTGTARHLQDHRRFRFDGSLNNGLHLLHVIEVECSDGVFALDGLFKHLSRVHKTQIFVIYHSCYYVITLMIKNLHKDNQDSRQMMLQSI